MDIKNKTVIVTGASGGIGLATAKLLTQNGAQVALVSRSKDKLAQLSQELKDSFPVVADMTKPNEIKQMVKKIHQHFDRIDILINNAGQGYDAAIDQINLDKFHRIFDLDLVGPLVAMQEVIPIMKKNPGGSIINISSGTALMYLPSMGAYASIKRALAHLSLTARVELQKSNINVSVVYPYITETDFEKNTLKEKSSSEFWENNDGSKIPPGDTAEYVAEKILHAITSGEAEVYAHDWFKNLNGRGK